MPCVPTGMKAGVCTRPCGVTNSPRRAAPSVLISVKEKVAHRLGRIKQTRIAVGIETIAGRDRVRIGALHRVEPAEGRDQHEQRRARQMEIGQHQVDRAEFVAGRDEDRGFAGEGPQFAILAGGAFQQPQRGRADRDDPPAFGARRIERIGHLGRHRAEFGMHLVAFGVVRLDRQERAGADVQRHLVQGDAARLQPRQQSVREMQARPSAPPPSPRHGRKHGLVVGPVLIVGRPAGRDIGR